MQDRLMDKQNFIDIGHCKNEVYELDEIVNVILTIPA